MGLFFIVYILTMIFFIDRCLSVSRSLEAGVERPAKPPIEVARELSAHHIFRGHAKKERRDVRFTTT
jgi:hypothetical protein